MNAESDEDIVTGPVLVPVREQQVDFYGDLVPAAQTEDAAIWVPLRPITEFLGLAFGPQRRRVLRDEVLAENVRQVVINTQGGPQEMICLPLKLMPGWLFGIQPSRVKGNLREKILRYQRDAYEVLWNAFKGDILPPAPPAAELSGAELAVENARALLHLAEQQLAFERALQVHGLALKDISGKQETMAAYMRGFIENTRERLTGLELQLSAGATISESDAAEVQLAVKNVGSRLQGKAGMTGYQQVYAELYRRYRVSSYKNLPAARLREVLDWLHGWFDELNEAKHD